MNNNIIFILNIKLEGDDRFSSSRSIPFKYSIDSWKKWADKNNYKVITLDELIYPTEEMGICWQRYYIFDLLENSNINYDNICMVDADTIIHPDTPDFFKLTNNKFTVAEFDGSFDWVCRSVENYSRYIFNNEMIDIGRYFGANFMIFNKKHKELIQSIPEFYWNNKNNLKEIEKLHVGTDQTVVVFLIQMSSIDLNFLSYSYNMNDMMRKEILNDDMLFTKCGWIYHFNAIPNNKNNEKTLYWMKKTWEYLY